MRHWITSFRLLSTRGSIWGQKRDSEGFGPSHDPLADPPPRALSLPRFEWAGFQTWARHDFPSHDTSRDAACPPGSAGRRGLAAGINCEPFAILPSAFYFHPSACVRKLTNGQLADIHTGRVVTREEAHSTLSVLRATMLRWRDLVVTDRANTALTTQEALESVRRMPDAIGYPSRVILAPTWREATVTPLARSFIAFVTSQDAAPVIESFGTSSVKKRREGS